MVGKGHNKCLELHTSDEEQTMKPRQAATKIEPQQRPMVSDGRPQGCEKGATAAPMQPED